MSRPGPGSPGQGHEPPPGAEGARAARRWGTAGLCGIGTGLACFLGTALLGPSVFQPVLAGSPGEPPYALAADPSPFLVVGLVAAGVATGAAGLGACLHALRRGWRVRAFPLVAAGLLAAAAFMFMPPVGSSDHLNYASYGRMAATGHDPYATRADDLPGDPVAGAPEEWRTTPSVYGPITTAQQAFAAWIGGGSVRLTVFALSAVNALAFAATALLLHRAAPSAERRLRAALLWTCNPLMLFHLMSGGHNDVLAIAPMVAALTVFRWRGASRWRGAFRSSGVLLAGVLIGAAAAIKMPAALAGGGPAWSLLRERRWRRLVALTGGAGIVAAVAHLLAGPHVLDQVGQASSMVSLATPWHLVDIALGRGDHRDAIKAGSLLLMLGLVVLLVRVLPADEDGDRRTAAALVLAWLLAAPYELPWYDAFGWALLALLAATRVDWVLLVHTTALSLAYLPARAPRRIGMPDELSWLFTVVRPTVIPWTLTALLAALTVQCLRPGRAPATAPRPRASAGSRG